MSSLKASVDPEGKEPRDAAGEWLFPKGLLSE